MPSFKRGEVKLPPFLTDLYQDLRDRRLLPIVVLLLVGIVAAPFLLNGSSDEEEIPAPLAPAIGGSAPSSAKSLTVVQAEPGLRNYKKRLRRRRPTDPFHQRFTGPVLKGGGVPSRTSSAASTTTTQTTEAPSSETVATSPTSPPSPPTEVPVETGGKGKGGNGGGSGPDEIPHGIYYSFQADVQITHIPPPDEKRKGDPQTSRKKVLPPSPLPGEKTPVVTYIGISPKTHKPLFVISNEVTAVFGEGKCISGTTTCQVMEVEEGFPETFVYGPGGTRYKVDVIKVKPVVTGHS